MSEIDYDYIIKSVSELEEQCFSDSWSIDSIDNTMKQNYNKIFALYGNSDLHELYMLAGGECNIKKIHSFGKETCRKTKRMLGYIIASEVAGETELLRIAVDKDYRNMKFGSVLLKAYIENEKENCNEFFLEVRCGNASARALYKKFSYEEIGIRKNYYSNPVEDAVIYGIKFKK